MIRRASEGETGLLNELALRSKAHWPYPAAYLEKCVHALWIDAGYVRDWPVFVFELENSVRGFFALKTVDGEDRLDHLWIDPPSIGKGIGRKLFSRAVEEARTLGWTRFRLAADPYALGFYQKAGCVQIGTVQSRIKPDLLLPHLEHRFD
jgi:GNAT superfamily N-acetyltransferase